MLGFVSKICLHDSPQGNKFFLHLLGCTNGAGDCKCVWRVPKQTEGGSVVCSAKIMANFAAEKPQKRGGRGKGGGKLQIEGKWAGGSLLIGRDPRI